MLKLVSRWTCSSTRYYIDNVYFSFSKETNVKEKKQSDQDLILPLANIFTRVLCTHVRICICWALQVSRPNPWAHIQVPHVQCVCVCVRIRIHTLTYTLTQK